MAWRCELLLTPHTEHTRTRTSHPHTHFTPTHSLSLPLILSLISPLRRFFTVNFVLFPLSHSFSHSDLNNLIWMWTMHTHTNKPTLLNPTLLFLQVTHTHTHYLFLTISLYTSKSISLSPSSTLNLSSFLNISHSISNNLQDTRSVSKLFVLC